MTDNAALKRALRGLVNTPLMPAGMYSQDCRDERHHGACSNCECWCHMADSLDRIAELLEGDYTPGHRDAIAEIVRSTSWHTLRA